MCDDGLVAVSSEAGAVPLLGGRRRAARHGSGPGQLLSVDPERGLLFDGELKRELARAQALRGAGSTTSVALGAQGEPLARARRATSPRGTRSTATRARS